MTYAMIEAKLRQLGVTDYAFNRDRSISLEAYAPKGKVWVATGAHTLVVSVMSNGAKARDAFMDDISHGLANCLASDCDYCIEEV